MGLIITILPVVTKDLPISPRFTPYNFFLSRCKFSNLTTRQSMVEFLETDILQDLRRQSEATERVIETVEVL